MQNHKSKFKIGGVVMKVLFVLLTAAGTYWAGGCSENLAGCQREKKVCMVEAILKQLSEQTHQLKSYQAQIEYKFSQPILESQTVRKGVLYYKKCDGKSALRINLETLKQDDEEEQKYIEQYIFDGVWLTHIDYQIKEVKRYQQAEPNEPANVFELVSERFPIIGFTKINELEKEFEIKLIEQEETEPSEFIKLHLKVRPESIYKDDYTSVDFWIDRQLYLPAKIVAVSTEEDIYEIKLLDAKVNQEIDKKVFEIKVPEGFGEEIKPLEKKSLPKFLVK